MWTEQIEQDKEENDSELFAIYHFNLNNKKMIWLKYTSEAEELCISSIYCRWIYNVTFANYETSSP